MLMLQNPKSELMTARESTVSGIRRKEKNGVHDVAFLVIHVKKS
jgi:hypothetical protein